MTNLLTMPQSFVAGELSAKMAGRIDDPKYQHGARRLENVITETSGCARRRWGTDLVREARSQLTESRLFDFGLGNGNTLFVEIGFRDEYPGSSTVPAYARFHADGGTELHSTAWSSSVAYVVGDYVRDAGKLYRCILANTNQVPPNITYWFPLEFVPSIAVDFSQVSLGNNDITFGSPHGFETGDPIEWTSDTDEVPISYNAPAVFFSTGFAIRISSTVIKLSLTAGGAALDLTDKGTGTHRFHRSYVRGELVSKSGAVYFCRTSRPIVPPGSFGLTIVPGTEEVYWYAEPSDIFEIPSPVGWGPITEQALFELTSSQQTTVLKFAGSTAAPSQIERTAPHTALWRLSPLQPTLSAPTGVVATAPKRGVTLKVRQIVQAATGPSGLTRTMIRCEGEHQLAEGIDHVLIDGTSYPGADGQFWAIQAGTADDEFQPINPETGIFLAWAGGGPYTTGTVRPAKLHSDTLNSYKVTAIDVDGLESLPSAAATVTSNLFTPGAVNQVTWSAVVGAVKYRIYRTSFAGTIHGRLGESDTTTFKDKGEVAPNLGLPPPELDASFGASAGQFPRAVTHYEGRSGYGGTDQLPQDVWLSRTNTESDFTYTLPVQATNRIHQRLKSKVGCVVRHLVPMGKLIALTDRCEFRIGAIDTEALTPDSFASRADTYVGSSSVQPCVMHNAVLFAASRGGHIFALGWNENAAAYADVDLCERATHLFDGFQPRQLAATLQPFSVLWACMEDGRLLSLTNVPGQQVFAWHQQTFGGDLCRSVAAGPESGEDRIYLITKRTINGATKRFVERATTMTVQSYADSSFSDCALTYQGAAVSVVTGLGHLEGRSVTVFADGVLQPRKTVSGGQITLSKAASKVRVGLPVVLKAQTMPGAFAIEAYGSGKPKSVSKVWSRVEATGSFKVGPNADSLTTPLEVLGDAAYSGLLETRVDNQWAFDGSVFYQQDDPLPFVLVSMHAQMALGGG